ncbi:NAD(P)-binding domain-containing protein [Catellatospora sp. NPDC049111]|uniref:pyrroline-5-carboxylate reductase family protein n=1 Tax=Catellatospora sp. NPDC049111 TaxID=3155271 RepID=UPI0033C0B15F
MNSGAAPPPRVALLGAGRLGEALVVRLLAAGHPGDLVQATVRTSEQAARLAAAHPIAVHLDTARAVRDAEVVILTVRPEHADAVLAEALPRLRPGTAVVSFVAGRPLADLTAGSAGDVGAFRVATNAVAVERRGLLALSAAPHVGQVQARRVRLLLSRLGEVVDVPESAQDVAAATLGSAAAFLACAAGGVLDAAGAAGVDRRTAVAFTADALRSAALILERAPSGAAAWDTLATPGGITAAGLATMTGNRVPQSLAEAVETAVARAVEMAPDALPTAPPSPWA